MAKQPFKKPKNTNKRNMPVIPGVTNYEKIKNLDNKKTNFHKYNPFMTYDGDAGKKGKNSGEADPLDPKYIDEDVYNKLFMMGGYSNHRTKNKSSYYGMGNKNKRNTLIRLSSNGMIDDVLTKLCDEMIISSKGEDPLEIDIDNIKLNDENVDEKFREEIRDYASEQFDRILKMYGFNQSGSVNSLWSKCYLFMVEGSQAYEIVWDDIEKPKQIVEIREIDSLEVDDFWDNGNHYWKHHKTLSRNEKYILMYDTQIVRIDWTNGSPNNRMSYVEQLMKPFNDLKIIDESLLKWTITNSIYRLLVKIPVGSKSRLQAAQSLAQEKHKYNDDIEYDSSTGDLNVNGSPNQMAMKTYFMGSGGNGQPELETAQNQGPNLADTDKNEYFQRRFYREAKIPYSRFDSSGGASWNMDTRSQLREEINYARFVSRGQDILKTLVLKPLKLQLVARYPELKDDDKILDAIDVRFNSYSVFDELMQLDVLKEKIDTIDRISDAFTYRTSMGDEIPFFSLEFLLQKYLPELDKKDLDHNAKMRTLEDERNHKKELRLKYLQKKYDPSNFTDEDGDIDDDLMDKLEDDLSNISKIVDSDVSVQTEIENKKEK